MITFGPIDTVPVEGSKRKRRVVTAIPVYLFGVYLLTIAADFVSDGMSFPPWQWTWDDPWHDRYVGPALLHDWLLHLRRRGLTTYPKWLIDWLFEGALRSGGVSALETWLFTNAVRTKRG